MKILMVTDKMDIGGAETHILTLIRELTQMNCTVTLVSSGGIYITDIIEIGVRCVFAPFNKRDPISITESKNILFREMKRCDIVHAHTRFTALLSGKLRGDRKYPPIVTTAHLDFPIFPFGPFAFWGDKTLAVSFDIKEYLKRYYKWLKSQHIL